MWSGVPHVKDPDSRSSARRGDSLDRKAPGPFTHAMLVVFSDERTHVSPLTLKYEMARPSASFTLVLWCDLAQRLKQDVFGNLYTGLGNAWNDWSHSATAAPQVNVT